MIKLEDLKQYEAYIINMRRDIHKHPEPGFTETRTSSLIEQELRHFGFEVTTGIGVTGLIGVLKGSNQGKTICLRADIDALRMQEENESPYKSINEGVMHSCGHDTHTAMLLGACKYFSEHKDALKGTLKVVFQSAEEGPVPGGGISVVEGGHIDDCDGVFGLHITTRDRLGTIVIKKGPAMAAPDEFIINVIGIGTHASAPHTGNDAIIIASQLVTAFQTIISRNISPTDSAVITVSTIHGGTAFNIIPEAVKLTGTIRTINPETRQYIFKRMEEICSSYATMHHATVDLEIIPAYPPLINDYEMSDFIIDLGKQLLGEDNVVETLEPSMGGEDFAYYLQRKPGAFFWLGACKEGDCFYNHNPKFNPDESAFLVGTAMHINTVIEFLKK